MSRTECFRMTDAVLHPETCASPQSCLAVGHSMLIGPDVLQQVVDFGEQGLVRCARCKAYMNAFMAFVDGGRKFRCNLCGHVNQTCGHQ